MVVLTSFRQPTDGIRHRQPNTTVYVNDNNLGKGTLFIAESQLSWISDSGNGFALEYPHISLHAISRDLTAFPQECLFLMLDMAIGGEENAEEDCDDNDENGDADQETTELRLVPDDRGMLDAMFHAMNACQALHPDPDDSVSDEDFYEDADDELPIEEIDLRMANLPMESMAAKWAMDRLHFLQGSRKEPAGDQDQAGEVNIDSGTGCYTDSGAGTGAGHYTDSGVGTGRCTDSGVGAGHYTDSGVGAGRCTDSGVGAGRCTESGSGPVGVTTNRREQEREERLTGRRKEQGNMRLAERMVELAAAGNIAEGEVAQREQGMIGDISEQGMLIDKSVGEGEEEEGIVVGVGRLGQDMLLDRRFEQDMSENFGQFDMAQDGRSFVRGSNQPQSSRAQFPLATLSHTVLEEDSHFDDVEN